MTLAGLLPALLVAGLVAGGAAHAAGERRAADLLARGTAFEHGEGVDRDPERAAANYCQAARLGNAEAMYALGWMYANGRGLPRDDDAAGALFAMAAKRGHAQAERMLRFTGRGKGAALSCLREPAAPPVTVASSEALIARLSPARRKIADLVARLAPEYGVDPHLALAIAAVESAFDPGAVSPKNAVGVMQLIPETAARFNVSDSRDARQNVGGGLAYLRWLLAYFEGDVKLVAAAYNAGEGAVERYRGVPPYRETRAYVERVLARFRRDTHPYDRRVVDSSPIMFHLRTVNEQ